MFQIIISNTIKAMFCDLYYYYQCFFYYSLVKLYMYLSNKIKYHIYIMLVSDLRACFHAVSLERVWFSVRLTSDICNPL